LSTQSTSPPCAKSRSQRCEPRNPAPPVTRIRCCRCIRHPFDSTSLYHVCKRYDDDIANSSFISLPDAFSFISMHAKSVLVRSCSGNAARRWRSMARLSHLHQQIRHAKPVEPMTDHPERAGVRRPAAFLDRDGVLNVDHGYTHRPEQLEWIDGAPEAVRLLNEAGYFVFVVTNQSGIARGYYDEETVKSFHAHMQKDLASRGARVDAFYYCPHHPEGTIKALAVQCRCRKPGIGMLEQAASEHSVDRESSFLIGDKDEDMAAARAFNIRGIRFNFRADSLAALVRREIATRLDRKEPRPP